MTDKIEKMTDDDFKKIMQQLGMPESKSLYSALKQVENHTWQACAARMVPEGWRFDRCSDGSINVIKDGAGGANVEQNAEQARRIPEEVLWMMANDLLPAAPEGKK